MQIRTVALHLEDAADICQKVSDSFDYYDLFLITFCNFNTIKFIYRGASESLTNFYI